MAEAEFGWAVWFQGLRPAQKNRTGNVLQEPSGPDRDLLSLSLSLKPQNKGPLKQVITSQSLTSQITVQKPREEKS